MNTPTAVMPQFQPMAQQPFNAYPVNNYTANQYFPFNPASSSQQRLQQMEQAYPHLTPQGQQQQFQQQMPAAPTLKGRPVSGMEEAKAAQIDFDGNIHFFTDIGNGKIYSKHIGLDGVVVFNTYAVQQPTERPVSAEAKHPAYNAELEINTLKTRISEMEAKLNNLGGGGNGFNANNGGGSRQPKPGGNDTAASGK